MEKIKTNYRRQNIPKIDINMADEPVTPMQYRNYSAAILDFAGN